MKFIPVNRYIQVDIPTIKKSEYIPDVLLDKEIPSKMVVKVIGYGTPHSLPLSLNDKILIRTEGLEHFIYNDEEIHIIQETYVLGFINDD